MSAAIIQLIKLYQRTLSPDHGWFRAQHPIGFCRFYPTCSEFTKQAVTKRGALRGLTAGAWRVLRCHPWSSGGIDPVSDHI